MISSWEHLVEACHDAGLTGPEDLFSCAFAEIRDKAIASTLRKVGAIIDGEMIPKPEGEVEEHVNNVLRDLAQYFRHSATLAEKGEEW